MTTSLNSVPLYRLTADKLRILAFCSARMNNCDFGPCSALGIERHGQLVGGVVYDGHYGPNINAHIAGTPGVPWLQPMFLGALFRYPFEQLGVDRMTGPVASTNERSIRLVRNMGFTLEATLKGAVPDGDLLLFVLWKRDCRFLGDRYV